MVILGIDVGYERCGWGVIEQRGDLTCLDYGCIETPKTLSLPARYGLVEREVGQVIARFRPAAAGVERLFFGRNTARAMQVSEVRGVILLALYRAGLAIVEPTPQQVKAAVAHGGADKAAVQQAVKLMLGLSRLPRPDDAADGLAVAIYTESVARLETLAQG